MSNSTISILSQTQKKPQELLKKLQKPPVIRAKKGNKINLKLVMSNLK